MSAEIEMTPPSEWRPDLPEEIIFVEKMWLQGAILEGVGFGAVVVVSFMCIWLLLQPANTAMKGFRNYFIGYVLVLFSMSTLFHACNSKYTELSFIDNRNYPGGPAQYENDFWSIPIDAAGNTVFVLANWMTDGLLLWRFYTIYRQSKVPMWIIMILPTLAFMGAIALGSLFLAQLFETNVIVAEGINWTLPYLGLSLGLNIVLSLCIVARLVLFRWRVSKALGGAHGSSYTSIAAIIIESAGLHAFLALLFLIPNAMGHPISITFLALLMPDQCLASLLIIFRVAQGSAWSANTSTAVMKSSVGTGSRTASVPMSDIHFKVKSRNADTTFTETQDDGVMVLKERQYV